MRSCSSITKYIWEFWKCDVVSCPRAGRDISFISGLPGWTCPVKKTAWRHLQFSWFSSLSLPDQCTLTSSQNLSGSVRQPSGHSKVIEQLTGEHWWQFLVQTWFMWFGSWTSIWTSSTVSKGDLILNYRRRKNHPKPTSNTSRGIILTQKLEEKIQVMMIIPLCHPFDENVGKVNKTMKLGVLWKFENKWCTPAVIEAGVTTYLNISCSKLFY